MKFVNKQKIKQHTNLILADINEFPKAHMDNVRGQISYCHETISHTYSIIYFVYSVLIMAL